MSEPGQTTPSMDPYQVLQVSPKAEQEVLHAAFRALAMKYHPDRDSSARASRRMIELNQAYAMVREPELRAQVDKSRRTARTPFDAAAIPPMYGRAVAPPARRPGRTDTNANATKLESGRYSGWTLKDLAGHDPDYLKWLSRHSSGLRYRKEISLILGSRAVAGG
ncbi:MAG TPA: DnaJ domain-containing protein [Candidatus Limnocylindria bacterium]|nr:DnaJ domain-containing protein [Candidatus Limnocylindria bacterium]